MKKVTDPRLLAELEGRINYDFKTQPSPEEQALLDADVNREVVNQQKRITDPNLLTQLNGTQPEQDVKQELGLLDQAKNAVYGFAGVGNKAMHALNPFSTPEDAQRIAAEQAWIKQNQGAQVGELVGEMAMTGPSGLGRSMITRALLSGGIEGLTEPGSAADRLNNASLAVIGSGLGEHIADGVGFLAKPFKEEFDPVYQGLVKKAQDIGLKLNAADVTKNKTLQALDNLLDSMPSSSAMQKEFKDEKRRAWQRAIFDQGGEVADTASPEVMGGMKDRIQGVYKELADKHSLVVDQQLKDDLSAISGKFDGRIPVNQKSVVASYLRDFDKPPVNATIAGGEYQDIRSMLDKQSKAFRNSDPATSDALRSIRQSVDDAMERTLSGANPSQIGQGASDDLARWKKANKDWMVMRTIESAMNTGDNIAEGSINPNAFLREMRKRDPNRMIYGKGDQALADIARVGQAFIPNKVPDSGTTQKAILAKLLSGDALLGVGAGLASGDPITGLGAAGLGLGAGIALPQLATKLLQQPGGYLGKGAMDLSKQVVPGLTRQRLLSEVLRNSGIQATSLD